MTKELTPVKEFRAECGGISHVTFYRLVKAGKLRITKMGRRTYVARKDREAFLAALPTIGGNHVAA